LNKIATKKLPLPVYLTMEVFFYKRFFCNQKDKALKRKYTVSDETVIQIKDAFKIATIPSCHKEIVRLTMEKIQQKKIKELTGVTRY
jgi:hypothetical protein